MDRILTIFILKIDIIKQVKTISLQIITLKFSLCIFSKYYH
jgi:hypothetical protein